MLWREGCRSGALAALTALATIAACGGSTNNGGNGGSAGSGGNGGGASCDPSTSCQNGDFCDYSDDRCGSGVKGLCRPRPTSCDFLYAPACGCDAKIRPNACAAQTDGHDVNNAGGCAPPDGMFPCGGMFCTTSNEYCVEHLPDVAGVPSEDACAVPSLQPTVDCRLHPDCACLAAVPCGLMCRPSGDGFVVTCPGG